MKHKKLSPPFQSTRVAKTLYWIGGHLSRVKTYSKMYSLDVPEISDEEFSLSSTYIGRRWTGWGWGYEVGLNWSARWDTQHWDHWALDHSNCQPTYCMGCKGYVCGLRDSELDA